MCKLCKAQKKKKKLKHINTGLIILMGFLSEVAKTFQIRLVTCKLQCILFVSSSRKKVQSSVARTDVRPSPVSSQTVCTETEFTQAVSPEAGWQQNSAYESLETPSHTYVNDPGQTYATLGIQTTAGIWSEYGDPCHRAAVATEVLDPGDDMTVAWRIHPHFRITQ